MKYDKTSVITATCPTVVVLYSSYAMQLHIGLRDLQFISLRNQGHFAIAGVINQPKHNQVEQVTQKPLLARIYFGIYWCGY